jgi:hypothetical protein
MNVAKNEDMNNDEVRPFRIDVPAQTLSDLQQRLKKYSVVPPD